MAKKSNTNKNHNDFGRVIPGARKDLYLSGILNGENFFNLSKDERLNKVSIKSIIKNIDASELKEMGFSPGGVYYVKSVLNSLNKDIDPELMFFGDSVEQKKEIAAYIYTLALNIIKNELINKDRPIVIKEDVTTAFYNILKNIYVDDIDIEKSYIFKNVVEKYPNIRSTLEDDPSVDNKLNLLLTRLIGDDFYRKFLYKHDDKYNPLGTSSPFFDGNTYGWSKLIRSKKNIEKKVINDEIIDNAAELIESLRITLPKTGLTSTDFKYKIEQEYIKNTRRQGYSWRNNKDVNAEQVQQDIGFNGIQWGKWINGTNERQTLLNLSYDSLFDLAKALNIDVKDISLNESLAIAYGSQGKSGSKAHYNPTFNFIHLNKMNGAGSLAHEWFHAYDNFLYKSAIKNKIIPEEIQLKAKRPFFTEIVATAIDTKNEKLKNDLKGLNSPIYSFVENVITSKIVNKNISEIVGHKKSFYDIDSRSESFLSLPIIAIKSIKNTAKNLDFLVNVLNSSNTKILNFTNMNIFKNELKNVLPQDNDIIKNLNDPNMNYKEKADYLIINNKEVETEIKKSLTKIYLEISNKEFLKEIIINYSEKNKIFLNDFKKKVQTEVNNDDVNNLAIKIAKENKDKDLEFVMDKIKKDINNVVYKTKKINDINIIFDTSKNNDKNKSRFSEYINKKLTSLIANNQIFISSQLSSFSKEIIKEQIVIDLISNDLDLIQVSDTKDKSNFYRNAKRLDSLINKKSEYYALPCELFARAGASLISDKLINTYLVAGSEEDVNAGIMNTYPNPRKYERSNFNNLIEDGIKTTFKNDFNLDLINENSEIITEEYNDIELINKKDNKKNTNTINNSIEQKYKVTEKEYVEDEITEKTPPKKLEKSQQLAFKF